MATLRDLAKREDRFTGGHRACAGCGATIIARQVLLAANSPVVVCVATGCLEVTSTIFPYSSWKVPYIHDAFENAAATISGVEAAYKALKRKGKIEKEIKFIAFGGDGGTYDIGFQSLSGAAERWHDFLYVCYNNEAYMNTGIQRSGATPRGADTTTAPVGSVKRGKEQFRKDLTACMVAHNMPYVAQTAVGFWADLTRKVEKALSIPGPKFINVLQPCRLGWGYPMESTVEIGRLAAETCFWPIYEVENLPGGKAGGVWKLNYKPKEKKPVSEYFKLQNRFRHLFKPGNEELLADLQREVDMRWEELLERCKEVKGSE